jgi:single-stranded-DNA-specific exonuclease
MKIKFKKEIKEKVAAKEIVETILSTRKIDDIESFLNPPSPVNISLFDFDKKYKEEFKKVIELLTAIKKNNRMIVVYTDYDADGITGGAILWETLYLLGFKVMPYVPDRKKEGYGFSKIGIDNVIRQFNPTLIISVDHGITKIKEVEYTKQKGVKVIITDHHLKGELVPKADAIFHIPVLSGSGVAYFFAKEIFKNFKSQTNNYSQLNVNFSSDYLSLASIGTVADLVPLIGPSRSLVKYGLEVFHRLKRVGIRQILKEAGIENRKITPHEIGFIIAPRINAAGRLENAINALRLLCTTKEKRAADLALHLGEKNRQRQDILEKSVNEAITLLKKQSNELSNLPKIIVLKNDHWHEGIIGLIAAKITEKFYRPTIVLTKNDGVYKASARSIPGFHITNFLRELKEFLIDVGGHEQAAGFSVEESQLPAFIKIARQSAEKKINEKILERQITTDLKIPIDLINLQLAKLLEKLQPFGIGNPQPLFYSEGILTGAQFFGTTQQHLKIFVSDSSSTTYPLQPTTSLELLAFNQSSLFSHLSRRQKLEVVYTIEVDRWGEKERVRGKIVHLITDKKTMLKKV